MVMLIRLFETASANPIVPYPDTFEFVWPSDVSQPEQLQLHCHDASGNIEYTNTIDRVSSKYFVGGQDIGDSFGLTNNITQCDLLFNINGIDRVVHYVNPQPVNCTKKEQEGVVRTLLITCAWRFDLSDTSIWNGATVTGSPPTTAPTSSHTATPPLKMTGLPPTETFTGAPNTTSAFVESESRQTNPGILQDWVRFLIGLLLAWLVEIPVLLIMTRILFSPKEISLRRVILLGFLVTLVTLPILWFVLPLFLSGVP